jgi:hypothetical protein
MFAQQDEVIRNFNKFLEEQQAIEGKAKLTLALFDSGYELVYDKVDLRYARPLNRDTFKIQGSTAMNDAIGKTLSRLVNKKKAIVLIHTDGEENSSREYSQGAVKELVDTLKKKWEFIFVGGDINARHTGSNLGIVRTAAVTNDCFGTENTYANFCSTTSAYRSGGLAASAKVGLVENGKYADTNLPLEDNNLPDVSDITSTEFGKDNFNLSNLSIDDLAKLKAQIHKDD